MYVNYTYVTICMYVCMYVYLYIPSINKLENLELVVKKIKNMAVPTRTHTRTRRLHNAQCPPRHCPLPNCPLHTAQGTRHTAHGTRHPAPGTRHRAHCTRHTAQAILHTTHYTLRTPVHTACEFVSHNSNFC